MQAYGITRLQAFTLKDTIRLNLNGFQQKTMDGTFIYSCRLEDNRADIEKPEDSSQNSAYLERSLYIIAYKETPGNP